MKPSDKKKENEAPQAAVELDDESLENVAGGARAMANLRQDSDPFARGGKALGQSRGQ